MIASLRAMILVIYPLFSYVQGPVSSTEIIHMQGILALFTCGIMAPYCVMVGDLFRVQSRYSGYALGWSLGAIFLAGLMPLASLVLVEVTGNENAPVFILIGSGLAALWALRSPAKKLYNFS